jgi:hypothetical protein
VKLLLFSNPIPDWQTERASRLHRACLSLQLALHNGGKICKSIRHVARRYNGRQFKSDPARRMRLSALTLRRAWKIWNQGGQMASAFRLKYRPKRAAIPAPVLVRFAEFAACNSVPSLKTAWQKFAARPGSFRGGRGVRKPLKISLCQIYRYFPAADFYQMQSHLKTIRAEQLNLAQLRLKVTAAIRRQLPDRVPGRRLKREINFEI